jgi:hypothetical protein
LEALFEEFSQRQDVKITGGLCRREYGALDFEVTDPNGYVLVFAQPDESNGSAADGNPSSSAPEATPRA